MRSFVWLLLFVMPVSAIQFELPQGAESIVEVHMSNGMDIAGIQMSIESSQDLELLSFQPGSFLGSNILVANNASSNPVMLADVVLARFDSNGISGDGLVGVITVRSLATATHDIWISDSLLANSQAQIASGNLFLQPVIPNFPAPIITITQPRNGESVTGLVNLQANVVSNAPIGGVEFLIDDLNYGGEVQSPYLVVWDASAAGDGVHSIQARARDIYGKVGLSEIIHVSATASNEPPTTSDTEAPIVVIQAPRDRSNADGTIEIKVQVSDASNTILKIYGNRELIASFDGVGFHSTTWQLPETRGWNRIEAVAIDSAGNSGADRVRVR